MRRLAPLLAAAALAGPLRADPPAVPTWAADVAPILMAHCVECHRPGQVAPFSLLTYPDAAKRAKFLAKTTGSRLMPPWSPDGPAGAFVDERLLSEDEKALTARPPATWRRPPRRPRPRLTAGTLDRRTSSSGCSGRSACRPARPTPTTSFRSLSPSPGFRLT